MISLPTALARAHGDDDDDDDGDDDEHDREHDGDDCDDWCYWFADDDRVRWPSEMIAVVVVSFP